MHSHLSRNLWAGMSFDDVEIFLVRFKSFAHFHAHAQRPTAVVHIGLIRPLTTCGCDCRNCANKCQDTRHRTRGNSARISTGRRPKKINKKCDDIDDVFTIWLGKCLQRRVGSNGFYCPVDDQGQGSGYSVCVSALKPRHRSRTHYTAHTN